MVSNVFDFFGFRIGKIGMEIMSIALPAALALAADPITSLVDTAFVGHIGKYLLFAWFQQFHIFRKFTFLTFICVM